MMKYVCSMQVVRFGAIVCLFMCRVAGKCFACHDVEDLNKEYFGEQYLDKLCYSVIKS
jgi:hypothetical protein